MAITNEILLKEIQNVKQIMKEANLQLLMQLTGQMSEMQLQIQKLNEKLINNQYFEEKHIEVSNIEVVKNKDDMTVSCESDKTLWSEIQKTYVNNCNINENVDENVTKMTNEEIEETITEPVLLEVATSSYPQNEFAETTEEQSAMDGLQRSSIMPMDLFNESTHIANCRDRHCLLCQSLCVVKPPELEEHLAKEWRCTICSKYFRRKYNLKNHMRCHTGEKPYQCNICKHDFRSKQALNYHYHKHKANPGKDVDETKDSIGAEESESINLVNEENSIVPTTPQKLSILIQQIPPDDETNRKFDGVTWHCPLCKKHFKRKSNVKAHMRIHTGEKPYTCEKCLRNFAAIYSLKSHICKAKTVKS